MKKIFGVVALSVFALGGGFSLSSISSAAPAAKVCIHHVDGAGVQFHLWLPPTAAAGHLANHPGDSSSPAGFDRASCLRELHGGSVDDRGGNK